MDATSPNLVGSCWPTECCVRLHGAKSLTGFKLCATTSNNMQQETMLGVVGQQCCVRLHVAEQQKRDML